jgi:alpha-glucuronidase
MITQDELKKMFNYNPETGDFVRKIQTSANARVGMVVGTVDGKGYLHVSIKRRFYRLHRLAFLYMTGVIPKCVDHKDRDRENNRWSNLRGTDHRGNAGNSGVHKHNTSGYRGVSRNSKSGKWHAQIKINGKQTYLGRFNTPEEAAKIYDQASREHFGEYATLNTPTTS